MSISVEKFVTSIQASLADTSTLDDEARHIELADAPVLTPCLVSDSKSVA